MPFSDDYDSEDSGSLSGSCFSTEFDTPPDYVALPVTAPAIPSEEFDLEISDGEIDTYVNARKKGSTIEAAIGLCELKEAEADVSVAPLRLPPLPEGIPQALLAETEGKQCRYWCLTLNQKNQEDLPEA